jgi:hypothetical protein
MTDRLDEIADAFEHGQAEAREQAVVRGCKEHGMAKCPYHITVREWRRAGAQAVLDLLGDGSADE